MMMMMPSPLPPVTPWLVRHHPGRAGGKNLGVLSSDLLLDGGGAAVLRRPRDTVLAGWLAGQGAQRISRPVQFTPLQSRPAPLDLFLCRRGGTPKSPQIFHPLPTKRGAASSSSGRERKQEDRTLANKLWWSGGGRTLSWPPSFFSSFFLSLFPCARLFPLKSGQCRLGQLA